MRTLTDATGETWTLNLTYGQIRQIKSELELDLLSLEEDSINGLLVKLMTDLETLFHVTRILVQGELEKRGLSVDDLANRLGGADLQQLRDSVMGEWIDFFQAAGQESTAAVLTGLMQTQHKMQHKLAEQLKEGVTKHLDQYIDGIDLGPDLQKLSELSGEKQGLSESIPTPSHSDS